MARVRALKVATEAGLFNRAFWGVIMAPVRGIQTLSWGADRVGVFSWLASHTGSTGAVMGVAATYLWHDWYNKTHNDQIKEDNKNHSHWVRATFAGFLTAGSVVQFGRLLSTKFDKSVSLGLVSIFSGNVLPIQFGKKRIAEFALEAKANPIELVRIGTAVASTVGITKSKDAIKSYFDQLERAEKLGLDMNTVKAGANKSTHSFVENASKLSMSAVTAPVWLPAITAQAIGLPVPKLLTNFNDAIMQFNVGVKDDNNKMVVDNSALQKLYWYTRNFGSNALLNVSGVKTLYDWVLNKEFNTTVTKTIYDVAKVCGIIAVVQMTSNAILSTRIGQAATDKLITAQAYVMASRPLSFTQTVNKAVAGVYIRNIQKVQAPEADLGQRVVNQLYAQVADMYGNNPEALKLPAGHALQFEQLRAAALSNLPEGIGLSDDQLQALYNAAMQEVNPNEAVAVVMNRFITDFIQELQERQQELAQQLEEAKRDAAGKGGEVARLEAELETLNNNIEGVRQAISDKNNEIELLMQRQAHIQQDLETAKEESQQADEALLSLQQNKEGLQRQIDEQERNAEDAERNVRKLQEGKGRLEAEIEKAQQTTDEANAKLQTLNAQADKAQEDVQRAQDEVDNAAAALKRMNEADTLYIAEIMEAEDVLKQANAKLAESKQHLEGLQRAIDQEARNKQEAGEKTTRLEKGILDLAPQIEQAQRDGQEINARMAQLDEQLTELQQNLERAQAEAQAKGDEVRRLETENINVEEQINNLTVASNGLAHREDLHTSILAAYKTELLASQDTKHVIGEMIYTSSPEEVQRLTGLSKEAIKDNLLQELKKTIKKKPNELDYDYSARLIDILEDGGINADKINARVAETYNARVGVLASPLSLANNSLAGIKLKWQGITLEPTDDQINAAIDARNQAMAGLSDAFSARNPAPLPNPGNALQNQLSHRIKQQFINKLAVGDKIEIGKELYNHHQIQDLTGKTQSEVLAPVVDALKNLIKQKPNEQEAYYNARLAGVAQEDNLQAAINREVASTYQAHLEEASKGNINWLNTFVAGVAVAKLGSYAIKFAKPVFENVLGSASTLTMASAVIGAVSCAISFGAYHIYSARAHMAESAINTLMSERKLYITNSQQYTASTTGNQNAQDNTASKKVWETVIAYNRLGSRGTAEWVDAFVDDLYHENIKVNNGNSGVIDNAKVVFNAMQGNDKIATQLFDDAVARHQAADYRLSPDAQRVKDMVKGAMEYEAQQAAQQRG